MSILPIISPVVGSPVSSPVENPAAADADWAPTDLSSLLLWLDASDATTIHEDTTSGRVSQWDDKSGNNQHMKSTVSATEPITGSETLNGLNVITGLGATNETCLDTVGNQTGSLAGIDSSDFEINIVFKQNAGQSTEAQVAVKASNGGDIIVSEWRNGSGAIVPEDANNYWFAGSLFTQGTPYLMGFTINTTSAYIRRNGTIVASQATLAAAPAAFDRFLLFCRAAGSNKYHGYIAEVVVTSRLSEADRTALEGYLMNKWGL